MDGGGKEEPVTEGLDEGSASAPAAEAATGEQGHGAPGRPYHLTVPRGTGWWRPLLGLVLILGGWLAGANVLVLVLGAGLPSSVSSRTDLPFADQLAYTLITLAAIALALPVIAWVARGVQHRRLGTLSSVQGRLRRRWLALCVAVAAGLLVVQAAVYVLIPATGGDNGQPAAGARPPGPGLLATAVVLLLVLVPLQSAAEEYLARGWLIQMMGTWTGRALPGVLVGGAVWTAMHGPSRWSAVAGLMVTSLVYGWLVWRTGGLEVTLAHHSLNNLVGAVVWTLAGQVSAGLGAANAGNGDWIWVVTTVVELPVYAVIVVWLHGRLHLQRTTAS
jgi:membrane protease YdiL (CAAX protease family)